MLFYVLISGEPNRVEACFREADRSIENSVPFVGAERTRRIAGNRSWALVGRGHPDPLMSQRVAVSNRGVLVVNGPVLTPAGDEHRAASMLDKIASRDPDALFQDLRGSYNCASFTLRNGLIAFSDFAGTYPVYWRAMDGCVVASNSPMALAGMTPQSGIDLRSVSWLIGHSNIFGRKMPQSSVEVVPPGSFLRVDRGTHKHCIRALDSNVWPAASLGGDEDNLPTTEWDDITQHLIENVSAVSRACPHIRLSLTGGKDSRLVLAVALAAGLRKQVVTFTNGPEGSPEVACAQEVAALAKVEHEAVVSRPAASRHDHMVTWQRLRSHAFRYAGTVCPWDGSTGDLSGLSVELTGFGGELYRGPGGHAKQFGNLAFLTKENLLPFWINYHQPMDPLGILSGEMRDFQTNWLESWIEHARPVWRTDVLPEKFFVENRICHWNGPLAQNVLGRIKTTPLLSPQVARAVFRMSPLARSHERFHFEVMRRAAPELAAAPFLQATWHPDLRRGDSCPFANDPWRGSCRIKARSIQSWQWDFVEQQRTEIAELLTEADRAAQLAPVFDVVRLSKLVMNAEWKHVIEIKTVLSAIGIAISVLGLGERPRDRPYA